MLSIDSNRIARLNPQPRYPANFGESEKFAIALSLLARREAFPEYNRAAVLVLGWTAGVTILGAWRRAQHSADFAILGGHLGTPN